MAAYTVSQIILFCYERLHMFHAMNVGSGAELALNTFGIMVAGEGFWLSRKRRMTK
jgi:hypothetical protein